MNLARHKLETVPEALSGLVDVALDIAWSWNRDAHELFRTVDPELWSVVRHDPVQLLRRVAPGRLDACARDPEFMRAMESVRNQLAVHASYEGSWFQKNHEGLGDQLIAYFCAEFAVHHSVPIYSGGLGILAGDHVKTASDLGVPMVAVGLLYARGYFDQSFDDESWQVNRDETFDPADLPLTRLHAEEGAGLARVRLDGRTVELGAWEMRVGRTRLILLDTDLPANAESDRGLTAQLYGIGEELRLKQEWILGVGGVRVLRALDLDPGCWHANEGHAAFMMVERIREMRDDGVELAEAVRRCRARSIFTTHTPVPAGHDDFTVGQIEACLGPVWDDVGISREDFMHLGFNPEEGDDVFHMTAAAIRLSQRVNGVSRLHGQVSREIWQGMWPERTADDVPIGHVTNGVHRWTWMSAGVQRMLDEELGVGWATRSREPGFWDRVLEIDDARVWDTHVSLKRAASDFLREQARRRWRDFWTDATHLAASGPLLDPGVLTLGFARRFATYKRADLLLREEERLYSLLTDSKRPVQIVFAGKAHPADDGGKRVLQRIHKLACDPRTEGRVAFIEDYEMHSARALFCGVDVWLNVPRVPMEASGTSGMKAALNLVPQLGTLDGWWAEGYNGLNGWLIPGAPESGDVDALDWDHLFRILEDDVVPMHYERDARGVPVAWVERMKQALWVAGRDFTTERMLIDYTNDYYAPALRGESAGDVPPSA
jgi:starch phosphorylase